MYSEVEIRNKPHALLIICRQHSGERVVRCRICYVGFSGERTIDRARQHIKKRHKRSTRVLTRSGTKFDDGMMPPPATAAIPRQTKGKPR